MNKTMTLEEIRHEGMSVLRDRLGVSGMIRFLQDIGINRGNWTEERHKIMDDKSVDEIFAEIKRMRSSNPPQPPKK